jgi:hypothetical protein
MSSVETMVVFQRSGGIVQPIRDNEVVSIARTVRQLLDAAGASAGARPSYAPPPPAAAAPPAGPDGARA